jgi:capsular polysaccharide biosynthesis protein
MQSRVAPRAARPTRRLFVSRADAPRRRITNEASVRACVARHGFETVVPSEIPPLAQALLFSEASHIVAPHGAGLANLLYAPQARVLEIFGRMTRPHYAYLASALECEYAVLSHADASGGNHADFVVDTTRLEQALGRLLA